MEITKSETDLLLGLLVKKQKQCFRFLKKLRKWTDVWEPEEHQIIIKKHEKNLVVTELLIEKMKENENG